MSVFDGDRTIRFTPASFTTGAVPKFAPWIINVTKASSAKAAVMLGGAAESAPTAPTEERIATTAQMNARIARTLMTFPRRQRFTATANRAGCECVLHALFPRLPLRDDFARRNRP